MKPTLYILCCIFLTITLSNCKKDCSGSYTIEGTIWNGTKGQPRKAILVKAVAGKGNSLISGSSNATDVGSARTDENGYFKITYNCIDDDMTGISLSSPDLPYSGISNENRLPINQNYKQSYTIPDSVSLDLFIRQKNTFNASDTLFVLIAMPDMVTEISFNHTNIPNGFYKRFRLAYKEAILKKNSLSIIYAIGYANYKIAQNTDWSYQNKNNLRIPEPEINQFTIFY